MALKETVDNTSWGDVHAYVAPMGVDGAMGTAFEDMGIIDDNGLTIGLTDGTKYEQKDINGKLWDTLRQEPSLTITVNILRATEKLQGEFWETKQVGDTLWVQSMVQTMNKSFKFENPKAVGSRSFLAPVASISMGLGYEVAKGFIFPCTFDILNTGKEGWFGFGVVKAVAPANSTTGQPVGE